VEGEDYNYIYILNFRGYLPLFILNYNTNMLTKFKLFYLSFINKFNLSILISKIFNISNLNKVIIIFTIGLISRIFIGHFYNLNVFSEYFHLISIVYYSFFSLFIVAVHEIINHFNINIIPSFITDLPFYFVNLYNYCLNLLKGVVNNIKSPIIRSIKLFSIAGDISKNITTDSSKMRINVDNSNNGLQNVAKDKPLISNILNMEGDFQLYDSNRTRGVTNITSSGESSSNNASN
jgi:hypothetical protein